MIARSSCSPEPDAARADAVRTVSPAAEGRNRVALLVSLSTAASLFEPWIYHAIIDDIAGVFVAPDPLEYADRAVDDVVRALHHLPGSVDRMFSGLLQRFAGGSTNGGCSTRRRRSRRSPPFSSGPCCSCWRASSRSGARRRATHGPPGRRTPSSAASSCVPSGTSPSSRCRSSPSAPTAP